MRGVVTAALASFLLAGLAEKVWAQGTAKPTAAAPAQATSPVAQDPPLALEGRFGVLWPQPPLVGDGSDAGTSTARFLFGGRGSWYFTSRFDRRLNLQFGFDYASLGWSWHEDPESGKGVRREGHWYAVTPAIGFDVLKTPRFSADIHGGPSFVGTWRTLLLQRAEPYCYYSMTGTYTCENFENVCDQTAYQGDCDCHWRTDFGLGAGVRWRVTDMLHVGIDYTWLSSGRHVLVGTVGVR